MADATPTRLGQQNGTGAVDALFYKKFTGEVLTAYEIAKKLKQTIRVRTIQNGKSAGFNATYRVNARYHTPGTEITGQSIKNEEIVVTLDDLLIADVFVARIDELKNHYDVRGPYATEIGQALALLEDRTIAQCLVKAARGAELFTGDGGGGSVQETDIAPTADFATSGADLMEAVSRAKQVMDEKHVPVDYMTVRALFKPAQWYLMARTDKNLNRDYNGGSGSIRQDTLTPISGVEVIKSSAPLFGSDVTPYNASTNADGLVGKTAEFGAIPAEFPTKYHLDLTNTVGVVWVEPAVAYLQLLGLAMDSAWDPRRRGTLLLAEMAIGMDKLRSKCAVEIKKTP